jgi:hypothetical protein
MTYEIHKPNDTTYYVAYSDSVTHTGVTLPGQVTTTGQPMFYYSTNPEEFLSETRNISMQDLQTLPEIGENVEIGIYEYNDTRLVVDTSHVRDYIEPQDSQYITMMPDL